MYTKNALIPIPGACASGRLDRSPISTVPMIAESAVVTYMASNDTTPSVANIPALTIRMYAIARNVVRPAMISVLGDEPILVYWNFLSQNETFLPVSLFFIKQIPFSV